MDWTVIQEKCRNSVMQIICIKGRYKINRPYLQPEDQRTRGSGFFIDIKRGIIVTNAHVVENAISIMGIIPSLGKKNFRLKLLSICHDRDLALLLLMDEDINHLLEKRGADDFNLSIGDSMELQQTDEILAVGYPLGQESIKFTTGVISGFQARINEGDSSTEREEDTPSYLVISAPLNGGNSGGPLLNVKGEVIGINTAGEFLAQNIGYAVGSRILLAIYSSLISPFSKLMPPMVVKLPKMAFNWGRITPALMKKLGIPGKTGIYVSQIFPDSIFSGIMQGDIILSLSYTDPYGKFDQHNSKKEVKIQADLDDYGDLKINQLYHPPSEQKINSRNMELKELYDIIPVGAEITIVFLRQQQMFQITATYQYIDSSVISYIYPRFEPIDYEIFAGICVSHLTLNHVMANANLLPNIKGKKRYKPCLIVDQVFPETSAYQMKIFKEGTILHRVQDQKVRTIDDLRKILRIINPNDILTIETKERSLFGIRLSDMIKEDLQILENFRISSPYLFY